MSDGTTEEATATENSKASPPAASHNARLQALEVQGRELLADVKLGIVNTETGLSKELEAAELRFQQFIHCLSSHLQKKH